MEPHYNSHLWAKVTVAAREVAALQECKCMELCYWEPELGVCDNDVAAFTERPSY